MASSSRHGPEDGRGRTYYFNTETSEARWVKPAEMLVHELAGGQWCTSRLPCQETAPQERISLFVRILRGNWRP